MASADLIDIPPQLKRPAEDEATSELLGTQETAVQASAKKKPTTSIDRVRTLQTRMRELPNWFPTAKDTTWTNVTRPGKSKRTLFVLTDSNGGQQFCMIGRVFHAALSETALSEPSKFNDGGDGSNTDLAVHMSMRPADVDGWDTYAEDVEGAAGQLATIRQKAIQDVMVPLIKNEEKVIGMDGKKLEKLRKKSPDKLAEALEDGWGGTGTNETGDIIRTKRRCYGMNDLSDHSAFMTKWLSVSDAEGQALNYMADESAVQRGDVALIWFRALAQITANNFHVSIEPRNVMILQKGVADGGGAGSASFAAALMKAMERGEQV